MCISSRKTIRKLNVSFSSINARVESQNSGRDLCYRATFKNMSFVVLGFKDFTSAEALSQELTMPTIDFYGQTAISCCDEKLQSRVKITSSLLSLFICDMARLLYPQKQVEEPEPFMMPLMESLLESFNYEIVLFPLFVENSLGEKTWVLYIVQNPQGVCMKRSELGPPISPSSNCVKIYCVNPLEGHSTNVEMQTILIEIARKLDMIPNESVNFVFEKLKISAAKCGVTKQEIVGNTGTFVVCLMEEILNQDDLKNLKRNFKPSLSQQRINLNLMLKQLKQK